MGQRPIYPRGSGQSPVYIPRSARQSLAYTHRGAGQRPVLSQTRIPLAMYDMHINKNKFFRIIPPISVTIIL